MDDAEDTKVKFKAIMVLQVVVPLEGELIGDAEGWLKETVLRPSGEISLQQSNVYQGVALDKELYAKLLKLCAFKAGQELMRALESELPANTPYREELVDASGKPPSIN